MSQSTKSQHFIYKNDSSRERAIERSCNYCNKTYLVPIWRNTPNGSKFCSHKCYGLSKSTALIEKICPYCKKHFTITTALAKKQRGKYCSFACRHERHPDQASRLDNLEDYFLSKIQILPNGCWFWLSYRDPNGYARIGIDGTQYLAHRVSLYLFRNFDLGSELFACHHCDNPSCVNPDHLFIGTQKDNISDCVQKGRLNHRPSPKGVKNHNAKLNDDDIRWIKKHYHNPYNQYELARLKKCSQSTIQRILAKQTWRHVED